MNKYIIKYGESLIDVSLKIYGDISYAFDLIKLNSSITSINDTNLAGIEIVYNEIIQQPVIATIKPVEKIVKNVTILENQNIFDLSLQIFGTVEKAFSVVELTGVESINSNDLKLIKFKYDYIPLKIPKYLNDKNIKIATKSKSISITQADNIVWDGVYDVWDGVYDLSY